MLTIPHTNTTTTTIALNDSYVNIWSPSKKDKDWDTSSGVEVVVVELLVGEDMMRLSSYDTSSGSSGSGSNGNSNDTNTTTTSINRNRGPLHYTPYHTEESIGSSSRCGGIIKPSESLKRRIEGSVYSV